MVWKPYLFLHVVEAPPRGGGGAGCHDVDANAKHKDKLDMKW